MLFANISKAKRMLVYFTAKNALELIAIQTRKQISGKFCLISPQNRQIDFDF